MLRFHRIGVGLAGLGVVLATALGGAEKPTLARASQLMQAQDWPAAAQVLDQLTTLEPDNARAWLLLGFVRHSQGEFDKALEAEMKAAQFPATAPNAMFNAACTYARKGDTENAFAWLEKARDTGRFDMTRIAGDDDLKSLRDDPRFQKLLPGPEVFADPFLEQVHVIHEWRGEAANDQFGWIARNIGDVDGDGVADVATSAPTKFVEGPNAGRVYVYSGRSGKLLWTRSGDPDEYLGMGIEGAGDVNADGIPDVIAGAPKASKAYVYSGRDGALLLTLAGEKSDDSFGRKVNSVGDFNGDGHDDVLVGAPRNDQGGEDAGQAYIFSGKDGSRLLTLTGERAGDSFGSSAGGYSKDGEHILVVGAPGAGPGKNGRVYVYRGADAELKFTFEADATGARLGEMFVSVVGDVDADGVPDVYASDWPNNAKGRSTGRVYVRSGADGRLLLTLTGESAGDGFGIGPADAGDVNGDGNADLIVGAWQQSSGAPSGGKTYLFSGKDGSLLQSYTGKVPGDTFGFDATGMGDVDGDGWTDFLLTSAWSSVKGFHSGRVFIISGKPIPKKEG